MLENEMSIFVFCSSGRQPFLHCGPVKNWNYFADRPERNTNVQQWIFNTTQI